MEQLIELFNQIKELAGAGADALKGAAEGGEGKPEGGPPMEGKPGDKPEGGPQEPGGKEEPGGKPEGDEKPKDEKRY
jgi:hypothetical protein